MMSGMQFLNAVRCQMIWPTGLAPYAPVAPYAEDALGRARTHVIMFV